MSSDWELYCRVFANFWSTRPGIATRRGTRYQPECPHRAHIRAPTFHDHSLLRLDGCNAEAVLSSLEIHATRFAATRYQWSPQTDTARLLPYSESGMGRYSFDLLASTRREMPLVILYVPSLDAPHLDVALRLPSWVHASLGALWQIRPDTPEPWEVVRPRILETFLERCTPDVHTLTSLWALGGAEALYAHVGEHYR